MPCTGKAKTAPIAEAYIAEMAILYPGIDIKAETLIAKAWLINNPQRQKTRSGIKRFLGNWYSRAQNGGNGNRASPMIRAPAQKANPWEKINNRLDAMLAKEASEAEGAVL